MTTKAKSFSQLQDEFIHLVDLFFEDGYIPIYQSFFKSPQFPFWSIVQIVWSLYVLHRSFRMSPKTPARYAKEFFLGIIMSFASREISSARIHQQAEYSHFTSPISEHPFLLLIYSFLFIIFEFFPYDLVYLIVNRFYYFVGLLQGTNQARYFVFLTQSLPQSQLPFVVVLSLMDQITERGWSAIMGGRLTPMSSFNTILRNLIFFAFFFGVTRKGKLADVFGLYSIEISSIFLAVFCGFFNAFDNFGEKFDLVDIEEEEKIRNEAIEEEKRKKIEENSKKEAKNKKQNNKITQNNSKNANTNKINNNKNTKTHKNKQNKPYKRQKW
ncbi:hypothetical protein TRFO_39165 [Tritrichomonas foetus]|uniref:Uncharacterized protein n=1 Tax=Tritrichomonas foetus TaxID=1144522 RepID=A0A1J4J8U9_9EUKA|nr:hypothetical protein TRFO_39165 [Tritrichomonas foetus]|eukprot:OHS94671.1 hypothetical protein TRFO_39165 [Tritrichomonas foetus]